MSTRRGQIISKAIEILKSNPQGVRYSELVNSIKQSFPDIPINTIHGTVWNLDATMSNEIYKADRGLFRHLSFRETQVSAEEVLPLPTPSQVSEEDFYQPFADYLKN